ncbi:MULTISPECIES: lasso peptide biosynthesis B2 protein [unclassified Novosphingobium]|uniref:lasso peptide biosynthesis B2 protein n=1 Tax=unclassified Novosphingobium TaxID=2644732 RepID=UPI00146E76B1|nr:MULTISPECIES: lasso peptide biosynthesis B2 protein [unclassified Novosphingobium]NMN06760.1 hypothetical protein [Novosphingobium sp. SG919]NMN88789.1 hypothetical protein [Novosphingobium sp. SG916]
MRYRLKEGLYYCIVGQEVIFLDLPENRYFALPSRGTATFRRLVAQNGEAFVGAEAALASLINAGYLLEALDNNHRFGAEDFEPPMRDSGGRNRAPFKLWPLLVAVSSEVVSLLRLRIFPLHSVLARASIRKRNKQNDGYGTDLELDRWVAAFGRSALILGRTNRCLIRSLAMFSVLRARGFLADLYIGVRSEPFSAHAWVQYKGTVLNDSCGQIDNYSPILVVR